MKEVSGLAPPLYLVHAGAGGGHDGAEGGPRDQHLFGIGQADSLVE